MSPSNLLGKRDRNIQVGADEVVQPPGVVLFLHSISDQECRGILTSRATCCGQKVISVASGLVRALSLTLFSSSNRATSIKMQS